MKKNKNQASMFLGTGIMFLCLSSVYFTLHQMITATLFFLASILFFISSYRKHKAS
ncbi:hypothetical protein [Bacillus weihaiensis]|uniref:hypothetical protein n=1 Tax=Bacillus weihaiensis TaxID=1547283 RepID=UPI0013143D2D|nr:hypothetical protein [Bacillus weihaiensis]